MTLQRLILRPFALQTRRALLSRDIHSPTGLRLLSTAPVSIADASFWRSLVPKPLRKENRAARKAKGQKEWNPATFFIVMFVFIGSMSIQMIALRNSSERYLRRANLRIGLLREVVERIQNGEDVDVEKVLGTGEPEAERDWEEMLEAMERDEAVQKAQREENLKKRVDVPAQPETILKHETETPLPASLTPKSKPASFGSFF